jgi:hypothetical protein
MIDTGSAPALASVLFIRIPQFPRRAVSEQAHLKSELEALVGDGLQAAVTVSEFATPGR